MTQKFEMFMGQMTGNRAHTQHFSKLKTEDLRITKQFSESFKKNEEYNGTQIIKGKFAILPNQRF